LDNLQIVAGNSPWTNPEKKDKVSRVLTGVLSQCQCWWKVESGTGAHINEIKINVNNSEMSSVPRALIFMPILGTKLDMSCWIPNNIFPQAIEVYFLLIVAMHFVQLRRSSDLNDENPNESAV